jgi:Domain of unknown function (DUF4359)
MTAQSKSKSKLKTSIAIAVTAIPLLLGGTLVATNPNKDAYTDYALEKLCEYPNFPPQVAAQFQETCKNTVSPGGGLLGRDRIKNMILSRTQRQNFFLFSIYTTEVFGRTVTSVGVFGTFVPIGVQGS